MRLALRFLIALLLINFARDSRAQVTGKLFTIVVKSGGELIKLLCEKKADIAVDVISGAILTVGDKTLSSLLGSDKEKAFPNLSTPSIIPNWSGCSAVGTAVATCVNEFNIGGTKPATSDDIKRALMTVQKNFTLERPALTVSPVIPEPAPAPQIDTKQLADMTFWWSIQSSPFAADYEDYLRQFPNGEFRTLAERKIAQLRPPPPPPPLDPCLRTEQAILQPLRTLIEATNEKNERLYSSQWMVNAIVRTYDNTAWFYVSNYIPTYFQFLYQAPPYRLDLETWRIEPQPDGSEVVRIVTRVGAWINNQYQSLENYQSFRLACAMSRQWAILENVVFIDHP